MPFIRRLPDFPWPARALLLALAAALPAAPARAAAVSCSSDRQVAPGVLVERFLPDDCAECWARPSRPADLGAFTIDWIVPGGGADAPLSAAALPEAARRLAALGYTANTPEPQFWKWRHPVGSSLPGRLRVAHGPAVNDYVGVSIAWLPASADKRPLDAWLLLLEELPAGTEGSPSLRRLVRAALSAEHIGIGPDGWSERRSMRIPAGADPARLRLVGWLSDSRGHIVASAASRCPR